jgi:predicted nucleic acid-binding protein
MTVVSDTSPLNYLILIEEIDLLEKLYGRVVIPRSVYEELNAPETPAQVRTWIANPPMWLSVVTVPSIADDGLRSLHQGEREALALSLQEKVDAVIIDER